jgi:hypothetical protein
MYYTILVLGSYYVIRSIFRFSDNITKYLFENKIVNLPMSKYEKINETISSTLHGILVTLTSGLSINNINSNNDMQYLTISLCFSYFTIDLLRCLYFGKYLFIIHHIASLYLLLFCFYTFFNNSQLGVYAMYLIFLLESNTPLLNIGFMLKEFNFHYSITCSVWIIHLFCFFINRIITMPGILFFLYYNEKIDMYVLLQLPAFILIFTGSVYWSYRQSIGIHKYLKENSVI